MSAVQQEIPFHNAVTGALYSAKNAEILQQAAALAGIEDRGVAGFQQWLSKGRCVRKGQHGTRIMMVVSKKEEQAPEEKKEPAKRRVLKTAVVFFESQTAPIEQKAEG